MLKQTKKAISYVIALGMLLSVFPASVGAEETFPEKTVSAENLVVNSTNTGFVNKPAHVVFGTDATGNDTGTMRVYELQNVFGLADDESALEFVAREQRENKPQFVLSDSFTTDSDFYITQDIYIGAMRDTDILQLGGRYVDKDGSRVTPILFFDGSGVIVKTYGCNYNERAIGGSYQKNNWYRLTMAVTDNKVKYYLDDTAIKPNSNLSMPTLSDMGDDININFFGTRIRNYADTTDWGGIPQSFVIKGINVVQGTYNPANTDTTIASETYTVTDTSRQFGVADQNYSANRKSLVSGIATGTTVQALLNNITLPTGASAKVVTINDDDKATTVISNETEVNSSMKLVVTAADGAMKIYDLDAAASTDPQITSSLTRYTIDEGKKTVTMPGTTVEKLKSVVTGVNGTAVKVVDANENEVTTGSVYDTMKLVAENGGRKSEYSIVINKAKAFDTTDALTNIEDGTLLYHRTKTTSGTTWTLDENAKAVTGFPTNNASAWIPVKNTDIGEFFVYKTKLPDKADTNAYKFTYTSSNAGTLPQYHGYKAGAMQEATKADKGDKLIINFKVNMEKVSSNGSADHSLLSITPFHAGYKTPGNASSGVGGYDLQTAKGTNTGVGDRISFLAGGIYLGGVAPANETYLGWTVANNVTYGQKIGTYETGKTYDVTVVKSRGTWNDNGTTKSTVITEGVYIDGVNLLKEPVTLKITEAREYFAIREIGFFTRGTGYFADLNVYMADNYNPSEPEVPAVPDEANLDITTDELNIDNSNIFGWDGMTVAEVKAAIDSDINTEVAVLNITGDAEVADNKEVSLNMLLRVRDKNYPNNVAYYTLTKVNSDTGNIFTIDEANGKIKVTRDICIYNAVNDGEQTVLLAAYDNGDCNRLVDVKLMSHTITVPDTYSYSLEMDYDEDYEYKAFMWDMTTLTPYEGPFAGYDTSVSLLNALNGIDAVSYGSVVAPY